MEIPPNEAPDDVHRQALRDLLWHLGGARGPVSLANATVDWLKYCATVPALTDLVDKVRDEIKHTKTLR